jgi:hypothetical protein
MALMLAAAVLAAVGESSVSDKCTAEVSAESSARFLADALLLFVGRVIADSIKNDTRYRCRRW